MQGNVYSENNSRRQCNKAHMRCSDPKEACDTLKELFSKKNDAKLQLLENELLSIAQRDLSIPQYFHKVKSLCREIAKLDSQT